MTLAVGTMALASLVLGVTPTHHTIGVVAPLVLLTARLAQGMACGGELPAAQTYLAEIAPARSRGRWSSIIYIASVFGNTTGIALGLVLTLWLSDAQMHDWGWRVPFVIGAVLGTVTALMRRVMAEPQIFLSGRPDRAKPARTPRRRYGRRTFQVIGLSVGLTVAYYSWVVAAPAYAISTLRVPPSHALGAAILAAVPFMALMPLWGAVSDRIGRRPVLLVAVLASAVLQFPLEGLLSGGAGNLFLALVLAMAPLGAAVSILPAVYAELFPTAIRASGMALPYSLTTALFGGTAPYLQDWVSVHLSRPVFDAYIVGLLAITAVTIISLPETRGHSLEESAERQRTR